MKVKRVVPTLGLMCMLLTITMFTVPTTVGTPSLTMGPVMDDVYFTFIVDPDAQLAAWKAGTIDTVEIPDITVIPELEGDPYYGYVHSYGSFIFEYYDFAVENWKHGWDGISGTDHGYPMNDTNFRRAAAHLTNTTKLIETDPWFTGFCRRDYGAWLPEQYGGWHNPDVYVYDESWEKALAEMAAGGFTYVLTDIGQGPVRGNIDYWVAPNDERAPPHARGLPLRSLHMDTTSAWLYYTHIADAWLYELRAFGLSIPDANVHYLDWSPYQLKVWSGDFDFHVLGTIWSRRDPIIMNFYFASGNAPPSCCNWRFWNDTQADAWIETYSTNLDYETAKTAAWNLQAKIAEECIMVPALSWSITFAANKDLQGFRRSGSWTDWNLAFFQAKWRTPAAEAAHGNALRVIKASDPAPADMNPFTQVGAWESGFLGLLSDSYGGGFGLTTLHPETDQPLPWIAYDWSMDTYPTAGGTGTKITYYIRDDVYAHDGVQFNASDVQFSLETHKAWGSAAGQAAMACDNLWKVEVTDVGTSSTDATLDGWPEAVVYQNVTNLFILSYTSMWGASILKHVWEPVIAGPDEVMGTGDDVDPRTVPAWDTLNPSDPQGKLTLLTGTGPWMFYKGDWHTGDYIQIRANRNYYRCAEISIADPNFDFLVDIFDLLKVAGRFLAEKGEPEYSIYGDVNRDKIIDVFDLLIVAGEYLQTW